MAENQYTKDTAFQQRARSTARGLLLCSGIPKVTRVQLLSPSWAVCCPCYPAPGWHGLACENLAQNTFPESPPGLVLVTLMHPVAWLWVRLTEKYRYPLPDSQAGATFRADPASGRSIN